LSLPAQTQKAHRHTNLQNSPWIQNHSSGFKIRHTHLAPNSTAKQKPPTQVQNFTPNSPSKPSAQKHAKTHKHSALTQGLAARKVQKHPGGQPAGSPGHAYAPDASSEDPDPRAASSDQSGRAVGRYKSRGANQRLGTPLKNPLASRAH